MAKKYDNEFKTMVVELLSSGVKSSQVSKNYDLNLSMINRWRREYKHKSRDFNKKRELSDTEKELRTVKMERDILKKAVSIFSKSDR